jgi:membrane protein
MSTWLFDNFFHYRKKLIGSALFFFYVSNFGSYNETFGSLSAVIILLMWFYLTVFAVLLGGDSAC